MPAYKNEKFFFMASLGICKTLKYPNLCIFIFFPYNHLKKHYFSQS